MNTRQFCRNDSGFHLGRRLFAGLAISFLTTGALLLACGLTVGSQSLVRADGVEKAAYPLKLAFLYQFAQFVQWPSEAFQNPRSPLRVCVVGADPFDPGLEEDLETRTVDQHPVMIMRLKPGGNLKACHVVFVPAGERKQTANIIESLKHSPVLTVGEVSGFAEQGGIINFCTESNKLRFEINLDAARQTPLAISSKVLALARIVRDPPHP